MVKKTVKLVGFILLSLLILCFAMKLLRFKSPDGIDQMHAFYQNEPNTVDVLFLGSSHMYSNINTGILWKDYGISAYDLGGAEQPFWNTYYYIKEALKTQRPKVLAVEIYSATIQKGHYQGIWTIENLFGMQFNQNFIEAAQESIQADWHSDYINRFARYHSRYSRITKEDFVYDSEMRTFKGFDPKFGTTALETPNIEHVTELTAPNEKMADYMIQIIDLAKEEDIPILLLCAPYDITEESQKVFNCFYQYAEENGVPYLDLNKRYEELGIDFSKDFADWSHLNESGNQKYTEYLGEYLKANYDLVDHRGDERFASWDENAKLLDQELLGYRLTQITDLSEYISLINNKASGQAGGDYCIMLSARNISDANIFPQDILNRLSAMGMNAAMLTEGGNVFIRNEVVEYSHSGTNYNWFCEDDSHDFFMEREYIESVEDEFGESKHDVSRIVVDGVDYFQGDALLNIVTFDRILGQVVDSVGVRIGDEGLKLERKQSK